MKAKQKLISDTLVGYKATDANLTCSGPSSTGGDYKQVFTEIGKWYEVEGDLALCANGFHWCPSMSGVWSYYSALGTRVFKIEAQDTLVSPDEPGAMNKKVSRRIRLIEEIAITGDRNTGNYNTGYSNTGYSNTGDSNTGDRNTGDSNTGNYNTGNGNASDFSCGFFNQNPETVNCFDVDTGLTRVEFMARHSSVVNRLSSALLQDEAIAIEPFVSLPGITKAKLTSLHAKFKAARKVKR